MLDRSNAVVAFVYLMSNGAKLLQTAFGSPRVLNKQLHTFPYRVMPLPSVLPTGLKMMPCPKRLLTMPRPLITQSPGISGFKRIRALR